ncbi:efflux RND transporter permease subunit [bacterium]|nr:efflux RND transporter permease subunit [bacterium]NCQ54881.1 efflux RND transporter permease subunit [Candidatus Parcubacteria bacterium]NCS66925.1 efflux RND transporter permease subunit [Candidatus Peregrinibacteria bacterium]NCS95871.1 efflux RND transporter permease subunit [bacterium]
MNNHQDRAALPQLWTFLLERFRVTLLFALLFVVAGVFSYQSIPQESTPDVEIPIVIVSTVWPGATAEDVENLVTDKIEQEISSIDDVAEYTSTSAAGISSVVVEFEIGTDMTENTNKVQDAVDDASQKLPDSILDDPNVEQANISSTPVLTLALSGDYSYSQLKAFAESLSDQIETIDGVKEARLSGVPDEQYHFYIDPIKLQGLGLSLDEVVQSINASNRDIPLGSISVRGEGVDVRVAGEIESVSEFMTLPLQTRSGQVIRLEDLGEVRREFDELDVEKLISTGEPSARFISIDVLKAETKTNVPRVVAESLATVDDFYATGQIPQTIKIDTVFNSADDIENSLGTLFNSGFQTLLVIGIVLLVALGWRESLLAFVAVPLTLLIAILGLYMVGETFNFLSLFALVLALGLLVDNAIIITEGISEGINDNKLSPIEAARQTLVQFRWPVITGTATTMLAFAPMMFLISGVSGEFIEGIPKTVILVLSASLFVSLFMLPVFGVMFFQLFPPQNHRESKVMNKSKEYYQSFMGWIFLKKARIYLVLGISFAIMIFAFSLPATGRVSVEIFPSGDENYFTASIEAPTGTDLATMTKLLPQIDAVFLPYFDEEDKWLKNFQVSVGEKSPYDPNQDGTNTGSTENIIGITINLYDKTERESNSKDLAPRVTKDLMAALPDYLEIKIAELSAGPPGGDQPVTIKLVSENLDRIDAMASTLVNDLEALELENGATLKNITDNRGEAVPQMTWTFDREKLNRYGLSPSQLQQTLRAGVQGITILQLTEDGEEIDVEARFDFTGEREWGSPESLDIVSQIPIRTPSGDFINLADVATFTINAERTQFGHIDGKRTISVGAAIEGEATAAQFKDQLEALIAELPTQPGDQVSIGGDNEESQRLITEMAMAMLLGVFLILVVLVLQFDSFLQAGVIVMLLPLSLMGVFLGFWLSGTPISFPAMIGIVALAGIIVNDSIVLIDRINYNVDKLDDPYEGFLEAGKSRMQPIILTSVTTIFGLLPLALSDPIWEGLGFAIIYGMTLATFLTIILVPCLIVMYQDISWAVSSAVKWPFKMLKKIFA